MYIVMAFDKAGMLFYTEWAFTYREALEFAQPHVQQGTRTTIYDGELVIKEWN